MKKIVPHLNLFRAGEAEAITGLSAAMQRDYRHRGFLPKFEGHARFNIFDMAEMYMLKLLSDRGFWPDIWAPVAKIAARGIAFHVLRLADAYEGDAADIEQFCVISNRPEIKVMQAANMDTSIKKYLIVWGINSLLGVLFASPVHSGPDIYGEYEFTDDIGASFSEASKGGKAFLEQCDGPATVYNLEYMSGHLLMNGFEDKAFVRLVSEELEAD